VGIPRKVYRGERLANHDYRSTRRVLEQIAVRAGRARAFGGGVESIVIEGGFPSRGGYESIGPSDSEGQMGQGAYSNDLRSRVVAEVMAGTSRRQAARLYRVSPSSAVRWAELHDETGSVSPRPRGGKSRSPLEPHRNWLLKLVAAEPDLTLQEFEHRIWEGVGLATTERSIRRFFTRHGVSFKKNAARRRTGPA
jgi:transposase